MVKKVLILILITSIVQAAQNDVPMDTDQKSAAAAMQTDADQKAVVAANGMQTDGERKASAAMNFPPIANLRLHYTKSGATQFHYIMIDGSSNENVSDEDKKRAAAVIKQDLKKGIDPNQCLIVEPYGRYQTLFAYAEKSKNPYVLYMALKNGASLWTDIASLWTDIGKWSISARIARGDFSPISDPLIVHMLYSFGKVTSFKHALARTEFPEMYQSDCNKQNISKLPLLFYMHGSDPLEKTEYNEGEGPESPFENFVNHGGYPTGDEDFSSIKQWVSRMVRIGVPYTIEDDRSQEEIKQAMEEDAQEEERNNEIVREIEAAKNEVDQAWQTGKEIISKFIHHSGVEYIVLDYLDNYFECPSLTQEVSALQKELDEQMRSFEQQYQAEEPSITAGQYPMHANAEPMLDLSALLSQSNNGSQNLSSSSSSNAVQMGQEAGLK